VISPEKTQRIKEFFRHLKTDWEKSYPGLNTQRLQWECEAFILKQEIGQPGRSLQYHLNSFSALLDQGLPLEYINKRAYFYDFSLYVDQRVLIPRSETEILVEKSIDILKSKKDIAEQRSLRVAEIGIGSGAISMGLLIHAPYSIELQAGDISHDALSVARINAFRLAHRMSYQHQVEFIHSDRMTNFQGPFDLIVSNPPYLKATQKAHDQVDQFEPFEALYLSDEDYLDWFIQFCSQVESALLPKGVFIMEGDPRNLKDLIGALKGKNKLLEMTLLKDYNDQDRFLMAKKIEE
jgi:release factor glutamine methyltransferase